MKKIETFFAPCMELLAWGEIKTTLLLSFATSRRTAKALISMFWWAILLIFGVFSYIGLASSGVLRDFSQLKTHLQGNPLMGFSVFGERASEFIAVYSLERANTLAGFLPIFALALVVFFAGVVAILITRSSREAKDMKYLASYLNSYFHVLYAFPILWLMYYISSSVWHLTLFFFFDSAPTWNNLRRAMRDAVNAYVRFLPFLFFVYGLFYLYVVVGFVLVGLLLAGAVYCASLFADAGLLLELVGYAIVFFTSLPVIAGLLVVMLMPIAISNTLYVKITTRFRELFSTEGNE